MVALRLMLILFLAATCAPSPPLEAMESEVAEEASARASGRRAFRSIRMAARPSPVRPAPATSMQLPPRAFRPPIRRPATENPARKVPPPAADSAPASDDQ